MITRIPKALAGIGSLLRGNYDPEREIQAAAERLTKYLPAIDFVNSEGWRIMRLEYIGLIEQMRQRVLFLAPKAEKHSEEIQRIAGVIQAAEIFVGLSDRVIRAHNDALKTIETNRTKPIGIL